MRPLESIYTNMYFKTRHRLAWRAPIICGTLAGIFHPKMVIDVGCAIGDLVLGFSKLGADAWGLEGSATAFPHMLVPVSCLIKHDLREKLKRCSKFDLVTCFEVAEHIEKEYVEVFLDNLQALAWEWVIMSAAPEGQGGAYHVNCQPQSYWIKKMQERNFRSRSDLVTVLKSAWVAWSNTIGIRAYYHNLLVFEKVG